MKSISFTFKSYINSSNTLSLPAKYVDNSRLISKAPKPYLYISIFVVWLSSLVWFGPRLIGLLDMAYSVPSYITMVLFISFICFAWLYGFYNVSIMCFVFIYKYFSKKPEKELVNLQLEYQPEVAILYTTCNDFVEESVNSCIDQDYKNYKVYILDDSSDEDIKNSIDRYQSLNQDKVKVIRRDNRVGFKAGNMNNALENHITEPYFAIADADEILPRDFLKKLVNVIEADDKCGFVQANHRARILDNSELSKSLGVGVDIHWKYYQPFRNDYGFVMFLGHGALIRTKCWHEIGGFPHIVSEDLGFAIHAREKGYRGRFVEDVICLEDFPEDMRSFRIRHMKWTRGTCEFLFTKFKWLIKAKNITWTEKFDILFPTLNLPLTLVYLFFMVVANLMLPYFFGSPQDLTFEFAGETTSFTVYLLSQGFESIYTFDFFLITLMTFFAPVLCFVVGLRKTPGKLLHFISHSTAAYAALGPLSAIGVISYLISGKAIFLVTGDKNQSNSNNNIASNPKGLLGRFKTEWRKFIDKSHPDNYLVQSIELFIGLIFAIACFKMFQVSFLGLCMAFIFMPIFHKFGWKSKLTRSIAHLPFIFIILGIFMASLSLIGLQTMFFGYGFHF
ncbi:glycosyltransferase [Hyunsoonleella flava]|uniref:Glycosyltransferase n=1 Tax=Hyunsoonleella flava TaxID=2527939 RepID=A0A4Q9FGW3_9FLAO|nr:glycosyltransferase family 2 protein [Hyunsoonleella flava]TBN06703.1 glycosyltransferase [Hyunsoonleella flava]